MVPSDTTHIYVLEIRKKEEEGKRFITAGIARDLSRVSLAPPFLPRSYHLTSDELPSSARRFILCFPIILLPDP
jgi:hypothetical protein